MGSSQSASFRSAQVVLPASHYVPTINKRFVKDRVTTLELHDQFWTLPSNHDYVVRDVASGQTVFKIGPISDEDATAPHRRRLLLDAYGVPVVGMERHDRPPRSAQYTVIPGGAASKTPMCTFTTQMLGAHEPRLLLEFTDPVSGKPMILDARGYWQSRDAVITITDDPRRNGAVYCIARICCDGSPLDGVYKMDVAAGVDLSFVLLLAAALEEQTKKHMTAPDRMALRNAVKAAEERARQAPAAAAVPQKQKLVGTTKPGAAAARAV